MKRRKQYIYNSMEYCVKAKTMDLWLKKYKHKETTMLESYKKMFVIEIKPKRRHKRSVAIRDLKKLYDYTFIELLCAEPGFDEGGFDSRHGIDCKWVKKHRIYVYHY